MKVDSIRLNFGNVAIASRLNLDARHVADRGPESGDCDVDASWCRRWGRFTPYEVDKAVEVDGRLRLKQECCEHCSNSRAAHGDRALIERYEEWP